LPSRSSRSPTRSYAAAAGSEEVTMGDVILSAVVSVLLLIYLTYALLKPERF
jgi:K+-transporting ATPase KdpF subunit